MGFFKNVSVNAEANTMTIGGSVTFNDVLDPLYAVEKEIRESGLNLSRSHVAPISH